VGHHDFGALMRGEGGHTPITVQRSGKSLDVSGDGFLQIGVPRGSHANPIVPSNGLVTMDGAALHQAARAVVNVPAATDARSASGRSGAILLGGESRDATAGPHRGRLIMPGVAEARSASGRSGAISLGGESRAVATAPPHRGKLTADAPVDGARALGTAPAALAASHAAFLAAARNAGRPDGARHEAPDQARAAARSNQNPANITALDPRAIIISETAPTHLSRGISIINVTALDAMLAAGSVTLDAGSIRLAPGTVLTWLSASTLTLQATATITIAGSVSAPSGLLILMAAGALADTAASKIAAAGINLQASSVTLAGSWTTSGGPIAIAGINAVTIAPGAVIAANGAQGGSVRIAASQGASRFPGASAPRARPALVAPSPSPARRRQISSARASTPAARRAAAA
jgi:hypothetical protein